MRIDEISGDTIEIVYRNLKDIHTVLLAGSTTRTLTPEFLQLINLSKERVYYDRENLEIWILKSELISAIYTEILELL
jgi:hypothetical protein